VSSQGGGVGIYIKTGLNFTPDPVLSVFHERIYESLVGTVDLGKNKKILVGSAYRPGTPYISNQNELFFDLFANQIDNLSTKKCPVFVMGDFNIDLLRYGHDSAASEYIDLLFSSGFIQTIIMPTRCSNFSATLIDHCLTNLKCSTYCSRILTSNISDHFPILSIMPLACDSISSSSIPVRDYSKSNMDRFQNNLNNINWSVLSDFDNVDSAYDYFINNFIRLF